MSASQPSIIFWVATYVSLGHLALIGLEQKRKFSAKEHFACGPSSLSFQNISMCICMFGWSQLLAQWIFTLCISVCHQNSATKKGKFIIGILKLKPSCRRLVNKIKVQCKLSCSFHQVYNRQLPFWCISNVLIFLFNSKIPHGSAFSVLGSDLLRVPCSLFWLSDVGESLFPHPWILRRSMESSPQEALAFSMKQDYQSLELNRTRNSCIQQEAFLVYQQYFMCGSNESKGENKLT